ncbi:MAG: hypothetical protein K2U26_19590 [Cyclobacteriaceae bacterium]|nr:hypothetical protein [Cyclobacteriaceae bacterium]
MDYEHDPPYFLSRFWEGNEVPDFYKLAKYEIEKNGHISIDCDDESVNIYQPVLAYIFSVSRVSVRNMDAMEDIQIDGLPYLKTFIHGYNEGVGYFENDFKALYSSSNIDKLVAAIKSNYYDTRFEKEGKIGWEKVKKFFPVNLNHKTIREEGYFSGIVSRVEDIVSKHPQLFKGFYDRQTKKDIRYWLTGFGNEDIPTSTTVDYEKLKDIIVENGHFIANTKTDRVKIYSPKLAFILCSDALPSTNMDTNTQTNINGNDYLQSYVEGYNEGIKYFDSKYSKDDVRDIHINYFHSGYEGDRGWNIVKTENITFLVITHKGVKKVGYYAGIVNQVEIIRKEYPDAFKDFDKCDHELNPNPIKKKRSISAPVIGLFCNLVNESQLLPKDENESAESYCRKVCLKFKLNYTDRVRQNFLTSNTPSNRLKVKNQIINLIKDKSGQTLSEFIDKKYPPKQNLYA